MIVSLFHRGDDRSRPAIVTLVKGDDTINVAVFELDGSYQGGMPGVPYGLSVQDSNSLQSNYWWGWPK